MRIKGLLHARGWACSSPFYCLAPYLLICKKKARKIWPVFLENGWQDYLYAERMYELNPSALHERAPFAPTVFYRGDYWLKKREISDKMEKQGIISAAEEILFAGLPPLGRATSIGTVCTGALSVPVPLERRL